MPPPLPPGQRARPDFPRFGHSAFAPRFPRRPHALHLEIDGAVRTSLTLGPEAWAALPRHDQVSDFHCVTTWSHQALRWSGVRFADLYRLCACQHAGVDPQATLVVLQGDDGYHAALPLEDLLADDVLLADRLDGQPLPVAHGAPLRLVAPAHYGYKNVKHLRRLRFRPDDGQYRPVGPAFMAHPRARVALEERGQGLPGWLLRHLYRPLIAPTVRRFAAALAAHEAAQGRRA